MDIERAQQLLTDLADGIDPFTGELLPPEHICNQPEIIRALHKVLDSVPVTKKDGSLPNAGKPWNQAEQAKLINEFDSGMKISAIAKEHGRSRGAIEAKLSYLGLIEDSYFTRKAK
jgi:hypothetical protein